ncbi:hypothetical protein VSDG_08452 [Cytospora chrysosperma]|uniref:Uncharacterized protein n=1 Tax=Cytospora chrysosperma TaxID=252740 RepID=A0A423VHP7_CYTCH|nr:hypothetical protein VSDG_08452 [Valsa sordida]
MSVAIVFGLRVAATAETMRSSSSRVALRAMTKRGAASQLEVGQLILLSVYLVDADRVLEAIVAHHSPKLADGQEVEPFPNEHAGYQNKYMDGRHGDKLWRLHIQDLPFTRITPENHPPGKTPRALYFKAFRSKAFRSKAFHSKARLWQSHVGDEPKS